MEKIGTYAFYVGLLISVIAGFANIGDLGIQVLVILGVIVGFLNVTGEETQQFLIGTVALLLMGSTLAALPQFGTAIVGNILSAFVSFVAGAALIVGLKVVYTVTKSK